MELAAYSFSLLALIDPADPTYNWKCYGRDVWVYAMAQMTAGGFNPPEDEMRGQAAGFLYSTDWLIGARGLTTSTDLTTARAWVAWMLKYTLSGFVAFPVPPISPGYYNSSSGLGHIDTMRHLGNNYAEAGFSFVAVLPLAFNDTTLDDP